MDILLRLDSSGVGASFVLLYVQFIPCKYGKKYDWIANFLWLFFKNCNQKIKTNCSVEFQNVLKGCFPAEFGCIHLSEDLRKCILIFCSKI